MEFEFLFVVVLFVFFFVVGFDFLVFGFVGKILGFEIGLICLGVLDFFFVVGCYIGGECEFGFVDV